MAGGKFTRGVAALALGMTAVAAHAQDGGADPLAALAAAEARAEQSRLQAEADRRALLLLRIAAGRAAEAELGGQPVAAAALPLAMAAPVGPPAPRPPIAQAAPAQPAAAQPAAEAIAAAVVAEEKKQATNSFGGIEFGVGISFTLDVGSSDRVSEASIIDGIVRVDDEDNGRARIMLESHYFFKTKVRGLFGVDPGDWGLGPFVALQPGTDDIIEAIALGGMIGFRRPGGGSESFNLGVGVVVDPNTRILGEGFVANQPPPGLEEVVRYKEEMQTGVLVLASFGF